jgi:hypothetical protein
MITLADAQTILNAHVEALKCDPVGMLGSVTIGGRTVTYKSAEELMQTINYWSRIVATLQRRAAGGSRHGYLLPNFRGPCR